MPLEAGASTVLVLLYCAGEVKKIRLRNTMETLTIWKQMQSEWIHAANWQLMNEFRNAYPY